MTFLDKWMDLEDIILSEVTQSQKNTHDMHSLIKWILAPKLRILFRRGNKIPMEGVTVTNLELRQKDGPCSDCHIQGSTP